MSYDNDSPNWVFFDDFTVTHTSTNVIQYNEYYPFGLRTENSWTREDHNNKFLYNAGAELNVNTGWYETFFRGYDAALGRFMQVDPLASVSSSHSPYHYAYNNPVLFNDPLGDRPEEVMRDLEKYGGGGAGYQMYDYSDSWGQGFGNNLYGQHRIGPGSGNYWSNGYAGANQNAAMMSTRTFNNHYRIRNDEDRAKLANNVGITVYRNGSSGDWGKPEGTSGYGEGSLVNNKYGTWVLVNGSWVDMTSSDQMANRIAWDQQGGPCPPGVDCDWVANAAKDGLDAAGYASGALGGIQIGMLEYRQSLSASSRIGTFARFRIGYGQVGLASRALGKLSTYAGAPVTTYLDYKAMQAKKIGPGRFTFRLGGTAASIVGGALIGGEFGGPYGALGGAAIGGLFWAGEKTYDGVIWFGNQLSNGMVQTENALKNGWYHGR